MPASTHLRRAQATRAVEAAQAELGTTDQGRLDEILNVLPDNGRLQLAGALGLLFPDFGTEDALTRFRQLRARLRQAAEAAGVDLELAVDTAKHLPPEERWCWFEGESLAAAEAERYSREEAGAAPLEAEAVSQAAVLQLETRDGKTVLRYFVSYARKDEKLKDDLLERLRELFAGSRDFIFELWEDREILPGQRWRDEIEEAIGRCQFGLLLVSPAFLASSFITQEELPRFVTPEGTQPVAWRRAVPVGLRKVPFDGTLDLKGLQEVQVFRHEDQFFSQRRGNPKKDDFALDLFRRIVALAKKHLAGSEGSWPPPDIPVGEAAARRLPGHRHDASLRFAYDQRDFLEADEDPDHLVPTQGVPTQLGGDAEPTTRGERLDALEFLDDWIRLSKAPPFCALLGEYGMGKTTTCKMLTLRLLKAREEDPSLPLPIYLDLRHLGETAKAGPTLSEILDVVVRKSWHAGREVELGAGEIIRLVQEEGAVAIFDGLDEVLVHLTPGAGQGFTRELWRILPPSVFRRGRKETGDGGAEPRKAVPGKARPRPGRLLVSCRTHYFRTLREQAVHLTGEGRDGISPGDYQALVLLPFTDEQIREYLRRNLPEQDVDRLLDTIRSIHNLPELAERPFTLSLIARQIPQLERWKMEGRPVTGVTLYRGMVQSWLDRDTGKHQLTPDHKQRLMEHLAAALWRSGRRSWGVGEVEQWLIDFLAAHPGLAGHYAGKDRELLKEDLRTATFLVNEGEGDFRFAHTSLQEFFLAAWLHRALVEGRLADWAMERPSPETLEFLGQLLVEEGREEGLAGLRKLRDRYHPQASELALAYALQAVRNGLPAPSLHGVRVPGADLRRWRFEGPEEGPLLNLQNADFSGARLDGSVFRRVDLTGASFREARMARAELLDGRANGVDLGGAELPGGRLRHLDLIGARFEGAALYRTQFLSCGLEGTAGLGGGESDLLAFGCRPAGSLPSPTLPTAGRSRRAESATGHLGWVRSCGWSPDGGRVVSGGDDGTVRVWDGSSGEELLRLEGHRGWVGSCGWSPDGGRVVSGGEDGTVRVWDGSSGEELLRLEGHRGFVGSCGWSPDGGRVVSGGEDGTVRVWDGSSGEELLRLDGHRDRVGSCGWSPDGGRVVSGGDDGTVRVWDGSSGEELLRLEGHRGFVGSCGWSPDGGRVVSGGDDGTVRVWDGSSGEELLRLEGHRGWVGSCGWSPDGGRVVSGGDDGTVRVWDGSSGEELLRLEGHRGWVWSCGWSPDGGRVVSGGSDGTVRVWDGSSGEELLRLEGHRGWVGSCGWSPDGGRGVSGGDDGTVRVWDGSSGEELLRLEGHRGWVWSCGWSPDGGRVVSGGDDGTVRVWDGSSGEELLRLEGHRDRVWSCGWSPDGGRGVSGGGDGTVRVWDGSSGEELLRLEGHRGGVGSCGWSPDGGRVVSGGDDGTVRVWDGSSGEELLRLEGHRGWVGSCGWSPDGGRVVSGGDDGTVRVWDGSSGEELLRLEGHRGWVGSCGWSPDGGRVVSGGEDGTVRVWDGSSGEELLRLEGHRGWVRSCGWSPDGGRVVSAGSDGTIRVWDAETGEPVAFLLHHLPDGELACLSPDRSEIRWATPGAWRWLVWRVRDPETGALTTWPAEAFGALPPAPAPVHPGD